MIDWLRDGLAHGAALCAFMSVIILGSLRHDPWIWAHSLPPDTRARIGPASAASARRRRVWGVAMMVGLVAINAHLATRVAARGTAAFVPTALAAYVCFQVFNLFDAVVIDLGLVWLRPRWAMIPGTEDAPELRDPRWHLRNYAVGIVAGIPVALLVAALRVALT